LPLLRVVPEVVLNEVNRKKNQPGNNHSKKGAIKHLLGHIQNYL
jgi:hypothetical protein